MAKKKYLIDTDIIIDFFKGRFYLNNKINLVGSDNCFVSEITIAELKFGALKSRNVQKQHDNIEKLQSKFQVIPISRVLDIYASERLRLKRAGRRIQDFDLLSAVTALKEDMILVTGNEQHHSRVAGISIENWRRRQFNEFIDQD